MGRCLARPRRPASGALRTTVEPGPLRPGPSAPVPHSHRGPAALGSAPPQRAGDGHGRALRGPAGQHARIQRERDHRRREARDRGRVRPCPRQGRGRACRHSPHRAHVFRPQGRPRGHRLRQLEGAGRPLPPQARGRDGGHRHRTHDHLRPAVQVPAECRVGRTRRGRRPDGHARGAQEAARGRGPVRRRAQAASALPARGDRRDHQPAGRGDPRHPAPAARPVPAQGADLARGGAGPVLRARGGPRDRGVQPAGRRRRAAPARPADRGARRRLDRGSLGLQRGIGGPCGGGVGHPPDLGRGARDRHHADRLRQRLSRAHPHRGRRTRGAGAAGPDGLGRRDVRPADPRRRAGGRPARPAPARSGPRPAAPGHPSGRPAPAAGRLGRPAAPGADRRGPAAARGAVGRGRQPAAGPAAQPDRGGAGAPDGLVGAAGPRPVARHRAPARGADRPCRPAAPGTDRAGHRPQAPRPRPRRGRPGRPRPGPDRPGARAAGQRGTAAHDPGL